MPDTRHRHTIEIIADDRQARQRAQELDRMYGQIGVGGDFAGRRGGAVGGAAVGGGPAGGAPRQRTYGSSRISALQGGIQQFGAIAMRNMQTQFGAAADPITGGYALRARRARARGEMIGAGIDTALGLFGGGGGGGGFGGAFGGGGLGRGGGGRGGGGGIGGLVGGVISAIGGAIKLFTGYAAEREAQKIELRGRGAAARYGEVSGIAGFERTAAQAQMVGAGFGGLFNRPTSMAARRLGMAPGEFAGQAAAMGGARGHMFGGPLDAFETLRMTMGMGMQGTTAAGLMGTLAPGFGGKTSTGQMDVLRRHMSIINMEGLRGSKADQFLSQITAHTQQMATKGIDMNLDSMADFMGRMQTSLGAGVGGRRLAQVAQGVTGAAGNVRQQMLAPFQQIGEAAMLSQAMQAPGGFRGMIGALEGMAGDPNRAIQAQIQAGNPALPEFLALQGLPMQQATQAAAGFQMGLPAMPAAGALPDISGRMPTAQAQAVAGLGGMRAAGMDRAGLVDFIKTTGEVKAQLIELGSGAADAARSLKKILADVGGE